MMKPTRLRNRFFLLLLMCFACVTMYAQQKGKYSAPISKVDSAAFYRIVLPPQVLAKSEAALADIRLYDKTGRQVPYLFGDQLPNKEKQYFVNFPAVPAGSTVDTLTTFIAWNKSRFTINQLNLRMRNTAVDRTVNLSGSDNLTDWFAIKENIVLNKADADAGNGIFEQYLNFPASTYSYYKVQVNNGHHEAVAILQAGIYQQQTVSPVYTELAGTRIHQQDTGKITRLFISLADDYPVSKIKLAINGSKYYKRQVRIYAKHGRDRYLLGDTIVNSANIPDIYLSAKTNAIELEVTNNDNPALTFAGATAYSLQQSLIAYLDNKTSYHLNIGDSTATAPEYDLKFFADSLQSTMPQATIANLTRSTAPAVQKSGVPVWMIWVAIAAAVALLAYLTIRLTKEVNARNQV